MPHNQQQDEAERALTDGSSGATADAAVDSGAPDQQRYIDEPHARQVEPIHDNEKPDQLAEKKAAAEDDQEALLDEAIEETFPGSDPISPGRFT